MTRAMSAAGRERELRRWAQDECVAAFCLARPANAMAAAATGRPLLTGVVRRWSTASGYRRQGHLVVEPLLSVIREGAASRLVVCGLDRADHVVFGPMWCWGAVNDPVPRVGRRWS